MWFSIIAWEKQPGDLFRKTEEEEAFIRTVKYVDPYRDPLGKYPCTPLKVIF